MSWKEVRNVVAVKVSTFVCPLTGLEDYSIEVVSGSSLYDKAPIATRVPQVHFEPHGLEIISYQLTGLRQRDCGGCDSQNINSKPFPARQKAKTI